MYNLRKRKRNEKWGELYISCAFILLVGITYVLGQIYCFGDQYVGRQWFYELISWDDRMNTSNEIIEH